MKMKFSGNIDELKSQLTEGGFSNYDEKQNNGCYCFRFPNGSMKTYLNSFIEYVAARYNTQIKLVMSLLLLLK